MMAQIDNPEDLPLQRIARLLGKLAANCREQGWEDLAQQCERQQQKVNRLLNPRPQAQ